MQTEVAVQLDTPEADEHESLLEHLKHAIDHASHLLPAQGPITVFIHHNTLHAFEDLSFEEGARKGATIFGCQPFLPEDTYRQKLAEGRIRGGDLEAVLREELGSAADETLLSLGTRLQIRQAMLEYPLRLGPTAELRWFIAETDALSRFRRDAPQAAREQLVERARRWAMRDLRDGTGDLAARDIDRTHDAMFADLFRRCGESAIESWSPRNWEAFSLQALWRVCHAGVHGVKVGTPLPPEKVRHRDLLLEATGVDSDPPVHAILIRFCAAFLDQGFAPWPLPRREQGFFRSFCAVYGRNGGPPDYWLRGLSAEIGRLEQNGIGPWESILESLKLLGVPQREWESFLSASLLSLRGWAGMVQQIEIRGDRVAHPIPQGSLVEYLAVQLLLERLSLMHAARSALGFNGPLSELRHAANRRISRAAGPSVEQRAFTVFQLAQVMGWSPGELHALKKNDWSRLVGEIESFSGVERRRVFHLAFERRYRTQTLDALSIHARKGPQRPAEPEFQVMFCLDEREESIRRHLEELAPQAETFGVAGFFNLPIYYQGAAEAHYVPLCPVVIRPQHWVAERVLFTLEESGRRRAVTRRALGRASHGVHLGSRSLALGAIVSTCLGVLASVPLVARILFPRLTARARHMARRLVDPPRLTELQLERTEPDPGTDGGHIGFSVEEMAGSGERLLRDIGLTRGFSRLILIVGHGSNSLNNPHNSAYNCGACGGSAGGPNARAISQILNDSRVRAELSRRGLEIPQETVFVGGLHNTCNDVITWFDLDDIPFSHRTEFQAARDILERVCERNAHERCRRFESAPLSLSFAEAREHVEERSEDLAQTRPECGHATNALCIVARRERTRGLYLDRRAFLTSYDPTQDDADNSILTRLLQAAVPVCSGINLEYYFSYVDPTGWGCGTKLPHNVSALLGVMDGAASDLRTGLPWQMVEIHEPVRLLFIIETTPDKMLRIMERQPMIGLLCRNRWIQLALLDPHSAEIQLFQRGVFHPYRREVETLPCRFESVEWYRGQRGHLEFAEITPESSSSI